MVNRATPVPPSCEDEIVTRGAEWLASPEGQAAPWFVALAVKREIEHCAQYLASSRTTSSRVPGSTS
jgi:hypothetical protein